MARVAVYITGHFRTFDQTWSQYRLLLNRLPTDIYIVLWDVRDSNDPTPVTEADIRAVCPEAKKVCCLPSTTPLERHGHPEAIAGQLYGLYQALQSLPTTYDWYLRLRTDLYFVDLDMLSRIDLADTQTDLWLPERVWYTQPNYPAQPVFNDYLWMGTYAATAYLAKTYTKLSSLTPTYLEAMLAASLKEASFRIRHIPGEFNLERRTRGGDLFLPESQAMTHQRQQREARCPRGFYINLDSRTDRRGEFEAECDRMDLPIERFPACRDTSPDFGCIRSHSEVLKRARDRGYPSVMIFEDDFQFLVSPEEVRQCLASLPDDYDVVMLSYLIQKSEPYSDQFDRVLEAQTASGYVVHARMYTRLIAILEEGLAKYRETGEHWLYMNDQVWKRLQPESRWYASRLRIGRQRAGYSDLKGAFVDYTV